MMCFMITAYEILTYISMLVYFDLHDKPGTRSASDVFVFFVRFLDNLGLRYTAESPGPKSQG